jgi:cullin-associated NEDD8-dissociated protein 1
MAAMVSAILLDREARHSILDSDPNHGQLREPLLKVLHLLRSMEYEAKDGVEVMLERMVEKVGQGAHQPPSVFSFYYPDFAPDGPVSAAGLVSPEGQLGSAPFTVGYLNGMNGLIQNGLTNCDRGFGDSVFTHVKRSSCTPSTIAPNADGALRYAPGDGSNASAVVEEISALLTPGRLSDNAREVITTAYAEKLASVGEEEALKYALKLFSMSPEFHTTNRPGVQPAVREKVPAVVSQHRPYKAVVVVLLEGGGGQLQHAGPAHLPGGGLVRGICNNPRRPAHHQQGLVARDRRVQRQRLPAMHLVRPAPELVVHAKRL